MGIAEDFQKTTATAVEIRAKRVDEYLLADQQSNIPYIVEGLIYRGCAHQLLGTIKAGKTTFTLLEVKAILLGDLFLGSKTSRTNILYVTEQPRFSFQSQLQAAGFGRLVDDLYSLSDAGLYVLDLQDLGMLDWSGRSALIRAEATRIDAGLVVIDTFTRIALIDNVADPGEANKRFEAIAPITTADGRALQLNWHERKAGGSMSEAGQGTVAYGGAVDMIIRLQKVSGQASGFMRQIETLGRITDARFQEAEVIELSREKDEYRTVGSVPKAKRISVGTQIVNLLPDSVPGWTLEELLEKLKAELEEEAPAKGTVQNAIDELLKTGYVLQSGVGYKKDRNDPFRYSINPESVQKSQEDVF